MLYPLRESAFRLKHIERVRKLGLHAEAAFFPFVAIQIAFSAVEALKSKSSIVAIKVASFFSALISVTTELLSLNVFMVNPVGVLKLSGETALAMASAVFSSPYSRVIVVSNFFAF